MNKVKLGDMCSQIGDGIHGTPKYVEKSDYYFINGNNLKNGFIVFDEKTKMVSQEEAEKYSLPLNKNTLLMSINGTLGSLAKYRNEKIMLGKSAAYINCERINPDYLFFYFQQECVVKKLYNEATGSTIKNLSLNSLQNFEIPFPPLSTQANIAHVLSSLDEKIELNNKINKELENIVKTIYEYWFVQNADKKWERKKLKDIFIFEKGTEPGLKAYSEKKPNENFIKFHRVGDIEGFCKTFVDKNDNDLVLVKPKDVVVTFDGTVGKIGIDLEGAISSSLQKIYHKSGNSDNSIIWSIFLDKRIQATIKQYATGSILLHASRSIDYLEIPYNKETYLKFEKIVSPLFSANIKNRQENAYLAQLRDFLLPLLMNGQVTVKDIESKTDIIPFKNQDNYDQRFNKWLQKEKHAARGKTDLQTLREIFDAMDEDDK